ncbi:hypothetical protein [Krasilnikovia sp. MM14-A1259]|uniref:hypothetical protein n=1 Tax=Krasilnikovia sp. MM14-A1259 TaxID=3373539 RepID=UPI00382CECCB
MYELQAVIGRADLLQELAADTRRAEVVALRQGLGMILVTYDLIAEIAGPDTGRIGPEPGAKFTPIRPAVARWSRHGVLACVDASFFGGDGEQYAEVWREGARVWGPVVDSAFTGPRDQWPINAALHLIGARPTAGDDPARGPADMFAEVGLGLRRDMDGWLRCARTGWTPELDDAQVEQYRRAEAERALDRLPADLDGEEVMAVLGIPAGPAVGAALRHLRLRRSELGPLNREQAETELRTWAARD